MPQEHTNKKEV